MPDRNAQQAAAAALAAAERHLAALALREPPGGLMELRFRRPGGAMRQRFYPTGRVRPVAHTAVYLGREHDVYVGCAPRRRRAGGRSAIEHGWTLWADCDTPQATAALAEFDPPASLIVRSGTAENRHAYWLLEHPLDVDDVEALNLRLARAIGADDGVVTKAHTILRLAGTRNHKHDPARPVTLDGFTGELHAPAAIAAPVSDIVVDEPPPPERQAPQPRRGDEDPLLTIAPAVYLQALTGLHPGRDGKVSCPFHADATPSLHVYPDPASGWYCYGCRRGGSIYDLAAEIWLTGQKSSEWGGQALRGREFVEVRERLLGMFFGGGTDISLDPA